MAMYKGEELDTKPTEAMAEEAQRGLDWRAEFGRGGTEVGVARARQLVNRQEVSPDTVRRMHSYFSRHEVDKEGEGFSPGEDGYPSAGRIAWALWGGDPGQSWARERAARMDSIDNRAAPDALRVGDFVSWDNPGGRARGRIESIERDGTINVPDSSFEITGTPEDPAALIRLYREGEDGMEATDRLVAHLFSTLTKISDLRNVGVDYQDSNPIESAKLEEIMDKRHIQGVIETEESVTIVFSKQHDEEEMEPEMEVEIAEMPEEGELEEMTEVRKAKQVMTRADSMDAVVGDDRRVRMSISSETPVERYNGMEILDHSADSIDLSFLNSGRAPLLLDHDPTQQIGVIESVELDASARKLRAQVRFGKSGRASEIYDDVKDGIRGNVSIGYHIKRVQKVDGGYRAVSWTPVEASIVSIPADSQVGVGRSAVDAKPEAIPQIQTEVVTMSDHQTGAVTAEAAVAKRNKEVQEIISLATRHNKRDLAHEAIASGASIEQFRGMLLDKIADKPLDAPEIEMTSKEVRQYSLLSAIRSASAGRLSGFEAEVSQEIAHRSGKEARGFYVPYTVFAKRDILTTSPANGSNLIATDHLAAEFIDALRPMLTIGSLGARMMQGLKGDVSIPKLGTKTSVGFVAENTAPSPEGAPIFTQVTMSPKTLAQFVDISRKLMMQSDPSVEQIVRDDMLRQFAAKIDEVAIEGGGANEPTGILGTNGIGSVAIGTNGGAITYASLVNLEREVSIDNALTGSLAYLTNPKVVGAMRQTARQSSGVEGNFILNDTNTILGYRVASTTLVPSDLTKGTSSGVCSAVIFGNFSDLMIGMWGSLDVLVDPYTGSAAGSTRVAMYQDVDVKVRHAESFAAIKDVTTA